MKVRYKHIESVAACAREELSSPQKLPIAIEKIITKRGFELKESALDPSVSGVSVIENGVGVISVRATDVDRRKRFTMAHELGHLLLHHDRSVNINHGGVAYFRDHESETGESWREIEANHFAACILMPSDLVVSLLKQKTQGAMSITDEIISDLADDFEVSIQAMSIRLSVLNLA